MRVLRSAARLALLAPFTLLVCLANVLTPPWGGERAAGRRAVFLRAWARGALRLLGVSVSVEGRPPSPPFLLASNHVGYLDIVVLASVLRTSFVAKSEVADWPLLGPLVGSMGTIFVDRTRSGSLSRVVDRMAARVRRGHGVTFFPEGTSSAGERVLPFRPGMFEAAVQERSPVSCASLWYGLPPGGPDVTRAVCWWGGMPFRSHVWRLLGIRRIHARVRFAEAPIPGTDRKELASAALAAVERDFTPLGGTQECATN